MMRTVWRIVRDPEEAADALQEALATIWRRRDRVQKHPNPEALVLKICIDASYDMLRKTKRHRKDDNTDNLKQIPATDGAQGVDVLLEKETESEIMDAVATLPKKQAVAILMRIVREESYETIARAMGCRESTVRIHVLRGRNKLKNKLSHLINNVKTKEHPR